MTYPLTFILPYFNEEEWIGATIDSLVAQEDQRFRLLLIDNGSTDESALVAARHAAVLGDRCLMVSCSRPGKTHALALGVAMTVTRYLAVCDADTHYPASYSAAVLRLFAADPKPAAVMAIGLYGPPELKSSRARFRRVLGKARRHPLKCHTGGYGQAFDTAMLKEAGGFDPERWPYVLEDHEVAHRLNSFGPARYDPTLFCITSPRRICRRKVSWTVIERLIYRFTPGHSLGWFFYAYLGPRLEARGCLAVVLREKSWMPVGS